MKSYIGVTGFTARDEVTSALRSFPHIKNRSLMVGALVTWKSLRNIPMKPHWAKQTPNPSMLEDLFLSDPNALNLIHYSTEPGYEETLLHDMLQIHSLAGPYFHGFQLNIAWPDAWVLQDYREAVGQSPRLVLQIGSRALEQVGETPKGICRHLRPYSDLVDDILFDLSSGTGKAMNSAHAYPFLEAVHERFNIRLGVAGGLGPDSLHLVESLVRRFPELNIDAQGKLRDKENNLDLTAVRIYFTMASCLLL